MAELKYFPSGSSDFSNFWYSALPVKTGMVVSRTRSINDVRKVESRLTDTGVAVSGQTIKSGCVSAALRVRDV